MFFYLNHKSGDFKVFLCDCYSKCLFTFLLFLMSSAVQLPSDILPTEFGMKREKTIENLNELAELTQQVQANLARNSTSGCGKQPQKLQSAGFDG